jgi:hypothetical protein
VLLLLRDRGRTQVPPPGGVCAQAQGTIASNLFQAFQCIEGGGRFTINLPVLLECLGVRRPPDSLGGPPPG